ncbi:fungal-specific transcription factor domain-containing protein [Cytidiella melzeri]|nr:fungal-specific transcription factor domain-containing protein [Cytidiella melzeri]
MTDVLPSPRKTMSSVSANARSQQPQKKPGAPKPKGAVRAKSGCYTCRIRRKKCDEQPNGEGACQTCVRLRLQCLGFGAKRPDWMRENNSVTELREKIKTFLASQGMIKGHSGSGPRSSEGEPPVLVLVENLQATPHGASTPPTPTLSAASNEPARQQQGPMTSYVRDPRDPSQYHHAPSMPPSDQQHSYAPQSQQQQTTWAPHLPELNSHPHGHAPDASMGRGQILPTDILYSTQPNTILSPASLVPSMSTSAPSSSWQSSASGYSSAYSSTSTSSPAVHANYLAVRVTPAFPPSVQSSFSPLYTMSNGYLEDTTDDDLQNSLPSQEYVPIPPTMGSYDSVIPFEQKDLVQHYMSNVLPIQYLLSDQSSIRSFIYELIRTSPSARDAACVLAAYHRDRTNRYSTYPNGTFSITHGGGGGGGVGGGGGGVGGAMVPVDYMYHRLFTRLSQTQHFTEGDAMAGLHAISTILFKGGRGAWEQFLLVASKYVDGVLTNNRFYGPEDVMKHCTESTRFIIKTTMWFDVLASVTTQRVPQFLETYRQLFDTTNRAYIEEPTVNGGMMTTMMMNGTGTRRHSSPPETSMLPVMGCENNIVLAIAEISNLACWKESQMMRNALSVPKLVERGMEIERKYINPGGPCSPSAMRATGHNTPEFGQAGVYNQHHQHQQHQQHQQQQQYHQQHQHQQNVMGLDGMAPPMSHLGPPPPPPPSTTSSMPNSSMNNEHAEVEIRRSLTNDIFRASARLYLHTVLSGDFPSCPEIIESVTDVIECLRRIPLDKALLSRSVLRSVVFGICIAGCLTDNLSQREFLMRLLDTQQGEGVGNVVEVKGLMQQVWARRAHKPHGQAVNWREVMRESQGELLLLV